MTARALERPRTEAAPQVDWERAVYTVLVSRALDELEETRLLPERKVLYQFTARGHDVTQALLGQIPLGRLGQADDIGAAVVFLASPAAAYITGATLHVNGGMYMN